MTASTQTVWTVPLPWHRLPLNLNDRMHWATKARKVAAVRLDAGWCIRAAHIPPLSAVHVQLHYRPRDNRRRDPDNLIATQKPIFDALVDMGVVPDDTPEFLDWSRPVILPAVRGEPGAMWLVLTDTTPLSSCINRRSET